MWLNARQKRFLFFVAVVVACLCGVFWIGQGSPIAFRVQLWLLRQGIWSNLDCWIDHANIYLPFLIEQAGNTAPVGVRQVRLRNRGEGAFEPYRYVSVSTVSDCARIVLHATVGSVGDEFGYASEDGVSQAQRKQAGLRWRVWYQKHKEKLVWDARRKVFLIH